MTESLDRSEIVSSGVLFGRGQVRATGGGEEFYRRLHALFGTFLQIKNLSVLIGAGASYTLGSPRIRVMTRDDVLAMLRGAGEAEGLPEQGESFIERLVTAGEGVVDLEAVLATLTAAMRVAQGMGNALQLEGLQLSATDLAKIRRAINRALARECDLPRLDRIDDADLRDDPLRHHRLFFQKLLRARRVDLPRLRLFTTNYDLLIEKALDASGISYFDGFVGRVERRFQPESFEQDLYLPTQTSERRLLRVEDVVYLYKLHGSITWRAQRPAAGGPAQVVEVTDSSRFKGEELALVFPTPHKEADSLGYPYSALFKSFSEALQAGDSALLVIGYGFADDHINRLIYQALGNPSFQLFAVDPYGVLESGGADERGGSPGGDSNVGFRENVLGSLAQTADSRIHILTGDTAGLFSDLAERGLPEAPDVSTDQLAERTQEEITPAFFPPDPS